MERSKKRSPRIWGLVLFMVAFLGGLWVFSAAGAPVSITTDEGYQLLKKAKIEKATINDGTQTVLLKLENDYERPQRYLGDMYSFFGDATKAGKTVSFTYARPQADTVARLVERAEPEKGFDSIYPVTTWWQSMLSLMLPMIIIFGLFMFVASRMQGGLKSMGFGRSKAKEFNKEDSKITFEDVAGEDEAVEELEEIKEFLAEPAKFHAVGAKIPKGVLLYGPPGTGKTLLARAVAGEAGVPFFSMSGSEFVEMFVGMGASRVRDLFEQARSAAPAIIFVDEIDAVGRHRGTGMGGGHDEREQTLNQLLVEMDGFDERTNVILIAATNRPDVLDPALLRPGRFDRQVAVEAPDLKGREAILAVHAKNKPMTEDVDMRSLAQRTPGFTGADLANVLNEAALLTARSGANRIDNRALDEAIDRVIAGPQKRTRIMNDHDKLVTAYHEGGHALCAAASNYSDPVTKVTILPRGRALGYTMVMPTEDRYSKSRNQLLDNLIYSMGGRVAEEMIFHDPSTGAANDIEKATETARKMVTQYGMSSRVGSVKLGDYDSEPFLGRDLGHQRDYSEAVAAEVDAEIQALMEYANREAWAIIEENRGVLDVLARRLLEEETLDEAALKEIFKDVIKRPERDLWLSYQGLEHSHKPPIEVPVSTPPQPMAEAGIAGGIPGGSGEIPVQPSPAGTPGGESVLEPPQSTGEIRILDEDEPPAETEGKG